MKIRRYDYIADEPEDLTKFLWYAIHSGDHGFCRGIEGQIGLLTTIAAHLLAKDVEANPEKLGDVLRLVSEYRKYEIVE